VAEEPVADEAVVEATVTEAEELSVETDETTVVSEEVVETVAEVETEFSAEAETIETDNALVVEQEEQAPVTAAAEESFQAPADRQPVIQVTEAAKVAITAGADIPGYTAGSTINEHVRGSFGYGEAHPLASSCQRWRWRAAHRCIPHHSVPRGAHPLNQP